MNEIGTEDNLYFDEKDTCYQKFMSDIISMQTHTTLDCPTIMNFDPE